MKTKPQSIRLVAAVVSCLAAWAICAGEPAIPPELVGHWQGNGNIIVSWCGQRNLPITLDIDVQGNVTGKVGDAILTQGRLKRNRGWVGRKLNIKTDYIIESNLTGSLVASEAITRSGVKMPLNLRESSIVGGLHSSGSKLGGKQRGILTARIMLTRRERP